MDRVTFQSYEVASAVDMNLLHSLAQSYLEKITLAFGNEGTDYLFNIPAVSIDALTGGVPDSQNISIPAASACLAGRIYNFPTTTELLTPIGPNPNLTVRRFWLYYTLNEDVTSAFRDIADAITGIKTPTNIPVSVDEVGIIMVVQTAVADPEAPPALGVLSPTSTRIGVVKIGYVDYLEGVPGTFTANTAAVLNLPGVLPTPTYALNDLTDVVLAGVVAGDQLNYNGANWINLPNTLNNLNDVVLAAPALNEVLQYDGANWINAVNPPSPTAMDDLTDVVAPAPATGDVLQFDGANWVNVAMMNHVGPEMAHVNDFRLAFAANDPANTVDTVSGTDIILALYKGNRIALYTGTAWRLMAPAAVTLSLVGLLTANRPTDVFAVISGGAVTNVSLEIAAWANATTRATSLAYQDGVLVQSGTPTRRYLGTILPFDANTISDTPRRKSIWNYYNRIHKRAVHTLTAAGWALDIAVWRPANNDTANSVELVTGVSEDILRVDVSSSVNHTANAFVNEARSGVGVDSTTVNSASLCPVSRTDTPSFDIDVPIPAVFSDLVAVGFHTIYWLERGQTAGGAGMTIVADALSPIGIVAALPM